MFAIAVLLVATLVTAFTLVTEKKEKEKNPEPLRVWRKPILYILTVLAFVVGAVQIRKADRETREADAKHIGEHSADQQKISGLQDSVSTLLNVNKTQYDRNQDQLRELRDQVLQLKLGKLTEEDRKKIAVLEAELEKALAPKPKAKIDFSFYDPKMKRARSQRQGTSHQPEMLCRSDSWPRTTLK
jgi:hypothetical protein